METTAPANLDAPAARPRPSAGWFAVAALLFCIVMPAGVWLIHHMETSLPEGERFVVPGTSVFRAAQPGNYILWHEFESVFQGQSYNVPIASPPEMAVSIHRVAGGEEIPLSPTWHRAEMEATARRMTWGQYTLDKPGEYRLEAPGSYPPRVMLLRRATDFSFVLGSAIGWILCVGGCVGAAALALWTWSGRLPANSATAVTETAGSAHA